MLHINTHTRVEFFTIAKIYLAYHLDVSCMYDVCGTMTFKLKLINDLIDKSSGIFLISQIHLYWKHPYNVNEEI